MEKAVICGYVDHIIYQNPGNGYTVMTVTDEKSEVTVTGMFRGIEAGERVRIEGSYQEHPSYGEQLRMESYEVLPPDDCKSIERYLGSGSIKGVGEKLAQRIVKKFGEDTFRVIEEEPQKLIQIKGISERIAREIAEQVYEKKKCVVPCCFCRTMALRISWRSKSMKDTERGYTICSAPIPIRWQRILKESDLSVRMKSQKT